MSVGLLTALENLGIAKMCGTPKDFTFQHEVFHDFESLIWVVIYAMMVRRKNTLAATDLTIHAGYKEQLDGFWGVHSYSKLANCHIALMGVGALRSRTIVENLLFTDPLEAEFFRAAMRLVHAQVFCEDHIAFEKIQGLFRTYIQQAKEATGSNVSSLTS